MLTNRHTYIQHVHVCVRVCMRARVCQVVYFLLLPAYAVKEKFMTIQRWVLMANRHLCSVYVLE